MKIEYPIKTAAAAIDTKRLPVKIIRLPELRVRLGVSGSSVYNWLDPKSPQHIPNFPKQIRIGKKAVGWLESEIDTYLENLVDNSRR